MDTEKHNTDNITEKSDVLRMDWIVTDMCKL